MRKIICQKLLESAKSRNETISTKHINMILFQTFHHSEKILLQRKMNKISNELM